MSKINITRQMDKIDAVRAMIKIINNDHGFEGRYELVGDTVVLAYEGDYGIAIDTLTIDKFIADELDRSES